MITTILPFLIGLGVFFAVIVGFFGLFKAFYIKVPQGTALIVNDLSSTPKVHFTGALVYPVIYKKELMQISLITLEVDRRGKDGLICKDNMRADITVAFYLRVNETQQDVLKVAKAVGTERASDRAAVNELFNAKFSESLKTVGKKFEFTDLFENRQDFRDRVLETIGNDLNGYLLEDVAIDYLEQTPKASLDPNNILDAEGIRKITELTATQNVITNELERNEQLAITKKNVETRESMLALERQQADAEARQKREIETIKAREEAETAKVREEERLKAEQARIAVQEQLDIREENRMREVEVAQQNRQRAVVIEVEKVTRAKDLEVVSREREVELQKIDKEKALEEQRKDIANVIRERIAVEKTVAQEEERIKEVRAVSEADRAKQVVVLAAQAQAEEELVRLVKQAEADEAASKHKAVEITTLAQAELDAAGKQAEAKKRLAEGIEAERAAPGLADARVREVTAGAIEKEGLAEARVIEAQADAKQKQGLADAKVLEENLFAQARGEEQLGASKAKATKDLGLSEAEVLLQKFKSEAEGLAQKFGALDALSDNARAHEEFRMQLEKSFEQAIASIEANKEVAKEQADVLAAALSKANIDIVGGEGEFFNSFAKALSVGKAIEGVAGKSPIVQDVLQKLLSLQGDKAGKSDGASLAS
ncbi:flotillin family protein [Lysobacter sp. 5GHs7-4]|uniref:flotillin family protein n=1 Tax=Lysobacter sp. 5GHs7-4 TaxID=2904253 RepID=UPI001834B068|nr:flotillin family protein [Lysobacter sp. 5GHs7-4]NUO74945.1 flotillin family protein [Lysobacter sp.]UHQ23623.1 flotillin family protein [Lysobacter sp. 5GHs7-4]